MFFAASATTKYKLASKLTASTEIVVKAGILQTENQEVSAGTMVTEGAANKELILGSSTVKLTATTPWTMQTGEGNLTIKAETSTIECTNASATFNSGNYKYNAVTFTGTKATINGGGEYTSLNFSLTGTEAEREIQVAKTTAITVASITKSAGTIKLASTEAGKAFKIIKTSGTLEIEKATIKDSTAEGGATFKDINGTDAGGNTGWTFETVVAGSNAMCMMC